MRGGAAPSERHLIADLHADPEVVRELRWFFEEAESAVGPSSNFGALVDDGAPGTPWSTQRTDDAVEERIEAMHAARRIGGWLRALAPADLDVIVALYQPVRMPEVLEGAFGELATLAIQSDAAIEEYRAALSSRRTRATSVADRLAERLALAGRSSLDPLRREAERTRARALRAYRRVRGSGPCVSPGED